MHNLIEFHRYWAAGGLALVQNVDERIKLNTESALCNNWYVIWYYLQVLFALSIGFKMPVSCMRWLECTSLKFCLDLKNEIPKSWIQKTMSTLKSVFWFQLFQLYKDVCKAESVQGTFLFLHALINLWQQLRLISFISWDCRLC